MILERNYKIIFILTYFSCKFFFKEIKDVLKQSIHQSGQGAVIASNIVFVSFCVIKIQKMPLFQKLLLPLQAETAIDREI